MTKQEVCESCIHWVRMYFDDVLAKKSIKDRATVEVIKDFVRDR